MDDRTVVYTTFYNPMEAQIVKARVEDSGFACFLADENLATIQPLYNQAIGGVRLIVFERDVSAITRLLAEEHSLADIPGGAETLAADGGKTICRKCGSDNVSYGQATHRRFSWWVSVLSFAFGVYPFKANECFHCSNCGYEFPKQGIRESGT